MAVSLSVAIHRALDFFFCDRCPTEVIEDRLSYLIGEKLCLFNWLWRLLPEEPYDVNHPIYWPRSWLGKVLPDQGKQERGGLR